MGIDRQPPRTRPSDYTRVNALEYEALVELRDVTFEAQRVRLLAAEARYAECLRVNQAQVDSLTRADLLATQLRTERDQWRDRALAAEARLPVKSEIDQPLFGPSGVTGR